VTAHNQELKRKKERERERDKERKKERKKEKTRVSGINTDIRRSGIWIFKVLLFRSR
jgi:hypothetical protein